MRRKSTLQSIGVAVCVAVMLACAAPAMAQVYRWTDAQGVVHYSGTPHYKNQQPVDLPKLQTVAPGSEAALSANSNFAPESGSTSPATTAVQPRITSPADGTTIRDVQNQVSVSVAGVLARGEGYVYYLDGKAQNQTPTTSPSMVLTKVWRGARHISVAVVGTSGQVLARSAPVTVYMHQPSVH